MCGGSVRMRNQPPQSYNNDEMTVLLDSDTRAKSRHHAPLLPSPHNVIKSLAVSPSNFLSDLLPKHEAAVLLIPSPMVSTPCRPSPSIYIHPHFLSRDDDLFFPQNIDPDYHESSRLLASTVLIEPDRLSSPTISFLLVFTSHC